MLGVPECILGVPARMLGMPECMLGIPPGLQLSGDCTHLSGDVPQRAFLLCPPPLATHQ